MTVIRSRTSPPWLATLVLFAAVACSVPELGDFAIAEIDVGGESMTVAMAVTPEERRQGLRDVRALPAGLDGMVFVYDPPRSATFVMEDTLVPLDIWWFDADGVLLGSTTMTPCVDAVCAVYPSPAAIGWALETPAGEVVLGIGDRLSFSEG